MRRPWFTRGCCVIGGGEGEGERERERQGQRETEINISRTEIKQTALTKFKC